MTNPGRGAWRAIRGGLVALCCTLLAVSGHLLGGGGAPSVVAVLAGAATLGAAFVVLADRQRGPAALVAATVGSQGAFHLLFALSAGPGMAGHEGHVDQRMVLGHALAAALMAWVLCRGEAALWGLYRRLRQVLVRCLTVASVVPERRPWSTGAADEPHRAGAGLMLATAHSRRGPPVGAAA